MASVSMVRRRGSPFGHRGLRDDFNPAVRDASCPEELVSRGLQLVGAPAHDDHFEAMVVIEVNVHRGPNAVFELVLNVRQTLGELADVMVVDEGDRRHRRDSLLHEASSDLGAGKVA